jgi:hypothetical protein
MYSNDISFKQEDGSLEKKIVYVLQLWQRIFYGINTKNFSECASKEHLLVSQTTFNKEMRF